MYRSTSKFSVSGLTSVFWETIKFDTNRYGEIIEIVIGCQVVKRCITENALTLVSCLAYSSTLKMEAKCFSETLVDFQRTTRRYIPEDSSLHTHRCENLKTCQIVV
jgi:hypothetical protein